MMIAIAEPIVYISYGGLAIGDAVGAGVLSAALTVAYVEADDL